MMKIISAAIFLLVFCSAVQAQQIIVRSGDHPTFSRITIPIPTTQSWEAQQTDKGVEILLPGFAALLDTSEVFVRMKTDRIGRIEALESKIILSVVCDCAATVFRSGELIVIDVADEGTALAGPTLAISETAIPSQSRQIDTGFTLPWIGSPFPLKSPKTTVEAIANAPESREYIEQAARRAELLNQVRKSLVEEMASAASIGILDNNFSPAISDINSVQLELEGRDTAQKSSPTSVIDLSPNFRVTSSMLGSTTPSEITIGLDLADLSCPTTENFDVSSWGTEHSFSAQIGPARYALMNERDQLEKSAAVNLARLYVYFGFGAEAIDVLNIDQNIIAEYHHIVSLANILEKGSAGYPNSIGKFTDCESEVALWATLSFASVPFGAKIDTSAALLALNNLPIHLRQIIAPLLSEKFLEYGDVDAAATAIRSIKRLSTPLLPQADLIQADLDMRAGEPAEELLEKVIDTNSAQSPIALIKLVEANLADHAALSIETTMLVEAYVQELRGTELGNQLLRTQVVALSQSQNFDEAFDALEKLAPSLSQEVEISLRTSVLDNLTKFGDDLTFLEHFFNQETVTVTSLPTDTKLLLAARLMDLGFAVQVKEVLNLVPVTPQAPAKQLLAARAAIQLRQPSLAQAELLGNTERNAYILLGQAKAMSGAYDEASELFKQNGAPEQAAQAAWLSEDWIELVPPETSGLGPTAALARNNEAQQQRGLGALGSAKNALAESAAAREVLELLLQEPRVLVAPDL